MTKNVIRRALLQAYASFAGCDQVQSPRLFKYRCLRQVISNQYFNEHILRILFTPSKLIAFILFSMSAVLTSQAGEMFNPNTTGTCKFSCQKYNIKSKLCGGTPSDACPLTQVLRTWVEPVVCPAGYLTVLPGQGNSPQTYPYCSLAPTIIVPPQVIYPMQACPTGTTPDKQYCVTCKAGLTVKDGQCSN